MTGQPGEPADWVKKQIEQLKKWEDNDLHKEMLEETKTPLDAQHPAYEVLRNDSYYLE